ncbi:MAG: alpha/beta hydrolase [Xanthomonadales bacterium]|jgi:pimeloyl-ACP methyl ester carboxylesterase|nr:alpha/beta hydrolase [Xanthomonadales bacterium]
MSQSSLYVAFGLFLMVASWYVIPIRWMRLLSFLSRRLTGFRSRKTVVDGVKWHYLEGGQGPTLVILHGIAGEADHWLGVAGPLRRQFHVLVPDLPGFGESQNPEGLGFRIEEQSRRLEAFLDHLAIGPLILAGNAQGAWIAAEFAARNPDRVRALWIQGAFGVAEGEHSDLLEQYLDGGDTPPVQVENMRGYADLVDLLFHKRPHVPYALARAGYLNMVRLEKDLPRIQDEALRHSAAIESYAGALTMPVLIEWGEEDQVAHPDGAELLHERIAGSTLEIHPEVGHLVMLEAPTQCVTTFQAFAAEHGLERERSASTAPSATPAVR